MNTVKTSRKRILERRERRVHRVRQRLSGTVERPRLAVTRSHRHFHAQAIDDAAGVTLASASTESKALRGKLKHGGNIDAALQVAAQFVEAAKAKGITQLAFDKRWYRYHGRIKAFADALRKAGLKF